MEHVPISALVVITLLQLCRAQTSNSTPEWYAANDINDTSFSPKPITELFSTETSFSPEDPIVVLSPSSSLPSNRGIVSSPTPITLYSDITESPPPNVIPLSSTELPPSPPEASPASQATSTDAQPETLSTIPQKAPNTETNPNPGTRTTQTLTSPSQPPTPVPRENIPQNVRPNQPPLISSRIPQQQLPRNIQFLLPTQSGNRIFQGQQLPAIGQPNVFVLYEQVPQNIRGMPPVIPMSPQSPQLTIPRGSPQQIAARPPNTVIRQQPQMPIQFSQPPNPVPPASMSPNVILSPQPNNQQQNNQSPINQQPHNNQQINNLANNQAPVNQMPNIQQVNTRLSQPAIVSQRPLRQRNRVNSGRSNNRGGARMQTPNNIPCQMNNTAVPPGTNPVITIRLRPSTIPRNSVQINPTPTTNLSSTVRPRSNTQLNNRNYERCLNSCRDKKDRICAGPESEVQINPNNLKGFPSMCHMACHNTFRANPIYAKITNGRCGKLRTRIQTVDNSKIRRDELRKSQYTIISHIPGTVVEVAP